ncbi:hypothetical protein IGI39_004211 [Enterococcus sp. AZ135]|uniref:MurR/RpiR family transcriptional regulator n=1 Tax=unclassified Enterococcus TaxID=2608891 RepID=UPI003F283700
MLLQEKLESYPFSPSERQVVDYLLKQAYDIQEKTTAEIAKATFSSKSTLTRIAKKLNYSGWNALKKDYLNELAYLERTHSTIDANYPFDNRDSYVSVANRIAQLQTESIEDTRSLLTHDELRAVTNLIRNAKTVHVFAVSNNLLLAQEFAHQMKRIKKNVQIHALQSEILFDAALAEPDSCAIIISYSGETTILDQVANLLKENQIPIIAITSIGENSTARKAEITLRTATREKLYSKISTFSTDASISYLLNVLYACTFNEDYGYNLKQKITASQRIEKDRSSDSSILKEPPAF